MRPLQSRMLVEFPQAFRQMLPIIVAQLVVLLKDTSLGYIVGYNELHPHHDEQPRPASTATGTCSRSSS